MLESRLMPPYGGGHGLPSAKASGLPRMKGARFTGSYPFASIEFIEPKLPINVELKAFNPLIPLNDLDSGLPAAIFYFTIKNSCEKEVEVLLTASLLNVVGHNGVIIQNIEGEPGELGYASPFGGNLNEFIKESNFSGIKMTSSKYPSDSPRFGSMAIAIISKGITYRLHWLELQDFWDEFRYKDRLTEEPKTKVSPEEKTDVATLGAVLKLSPAEKKRVPIILSWHFPNMLKYWELRGLEYWKLRELEESEGKLLRTYYSTKFKDAWDVAGYVVNNLKRLEEETTGFHNALFSSTLPSYVLDAVSSQISTIRTATCFRLSDGNFYGFEGCSDNKGCCPLNCTHVWNYEQTLAFLFPQLERTMRKVDFLTNTDERGDMAFRTVLPLGSGRWGFTAADGQMGCIMRLYREWKFSGDNEFLHQLWPKAKKALEFAWDSWDKDKDGVIEGEQHNTYDVEFYGPNTMMGTLYLGALRAAEKMARSIGDDASAETYGNIYEKGVEKLDKELFNGEYYIQKYDSNQILKYQYGEGCLSDQLLGEWLAQVVGLGRMLPKEHIDSALLSIFKYNWQNDLLEHSCSQRIYALNDERGLLVCSWPKGKRPKFPFFYCDEVWTGIEYQVASHLIFEGLVREGLTIVKGKRERHDGIRRNPYDEPECGHHYARAMASWSVLLALCGYSFDGLKNKLGFNPRINPHNFKCFFSTNTSWGEVSQEITKNSYTAKIRVLWGSTKIKFINLKIPEDYSGRHKASIITKNGEKDIPIKVEGEDFVFSDTIELKENDELKLVKI